MKLNEATIFLLFLAVSFTISAAYTFISEQYLLSLTSVYVVILSIILLRIGSDRDG